MMVKDYSLWLNWEQNTLFSCLKYYCTYENVHRYGFLTDTQKRDTHIRAHDIRVDKQTWTQSTLTHTYTPNTQTHTAYTPHTLAPLLPTHMHTHACSYAHMRAHRDRDLAEIHSSFRTETYLADTHSSFRTRTDWAKILKKTFKTTGQTGSKHVFFSEPVRTCFFFFFT